MAKQKIVVARNGSELAKALGFPVAAAREWKVRSDLTTKLISLAKKDKLTHAEIAKKAKTSRTRITSILNYNLQSVSTDLLIRVLASLGYEVTFSIKRTKLAA